MQTRNITIRWKKPHIHVHEMSRGGTSAGTEAECGSQGAGRGSEGQRESSMVDTNVCRMRGAMFMPQVFEKESERRGASEDSDPDGREARHPERSCTRPMLPQRLCVQHVPREEARPTASLREPRRAGLCLWSELQARTRSRSKQCRSVVYTT